MNPRRTLVFLLGLGLPLIATGAEDSPGGPRKLFNGRDLGGWTIKVDRDTKGYAPESSPDTVFQVVDGMIRISGERLGTLTTVEEYADYRLKLEFRWGDKKWPPREREVRDSGVLLHCTGPDKFWTRSIECQIQEHDTGDFWMVGGTSMTCEGQVEKSYRKKSKDAEKPTGEWNTVEIVCEGDAITNIINGQTVNQGVKASVRRGKILLQSEGAEVFFRKIELTPISTVGR